MSLKTYNEWLKLYEMQLNEASSTTHFTPKSTDKEAFIQMFPTKYASHSTSGRIKNLQNVSAEEFVKDLQNFFGENFDYVIIPPSGKPQNLRMSSYSGSFPTVEYKIDGKWYYVTLAGGKDSGIKILAENYEAGIVYAYNTLVLGMDRAQALRVGNIDEKVFQVFEKGVKEVSEKIALSLPKMGPLTWLGSASMPTVNWSVPNTPPKTDIYSSSKRISLKQAGTSQLVSSTTESIAIFNAALDYYEYHDKALLKNQMAEIIEKIQEKFVSFKTDKSISSIKSQIVKAWLEYRSPMIRDLVQKLLPQKEVNTQKKIDEIVKKHATAEIILAGIGDRKQGWETWLIKGISDGSQVFQDWWKNKYLKSMISNERSNLEKILQATLNHRYLEENLRRIFTENPEFLKWVVYEASTGNRKFTGQVKKLANQVSEKAVADSLLVFDTRGIQKFDNLTPEWAKQFSDVVKIVVGFKNAGNLAMSSFRLLTESHDFKNQNYLEKILNEEFKILVNKISSINEDFKFIDNFKNFVNATWNKITKAISDFYQNVFKKVLDKLVEFANQGIRVLASALGLEFEGKAKVIINF